MKQVAQLARGAPEFRLRHRELCRGNPRSWACGAALFLTIMLRALQAEAVPESRPALLGTGPESFVNLIDAEALMAKGQRDAWVMFQCTITNDGRVGPVISYSVSPDSELLKAEVSRQLKKARFIPAIYKGRPTHAGMAGTVLFVVAEGKPRVRVYQNQDMDELKRGADFIAPQAVHDPSARQMPAYPGHAGLLGIGGSVVLQHSVDASGKTTDLRVISENPPGHRFGANAWHRVKRLTWLPAYRSGKPTASVTVFEFRFHGR